MNRVNYVFLYLCVFLLISCEGRTGYLDENQLSKVSELTDAEWLVAFYMTGTHDWGGWEEYWLIEKLNKDDLWIQAASKDPAIYPNQVSHRYRLKARRIDANSKPPK